MKIIKIQDLLDIKEYRTRTRMKLQDLVGKTIVITGFEPKPSKKYGKDGYKVKLYVDKKEVEIFTCATSVVQQLNALKVKVSELSNCQVGIACMVQKNGEAFFLEEFQKKEERTEKTLGETENGGSSIQTT